jgi:hypothetical protein
MEKPRMLLGNALAGFLDAGMGAFIAAATLSALGTGPALWHLPLGAALALLPDFDILPAILRMREVNSNHHATLLHRPLLAIPAAALAAFLLGGPAWSAAAFLCVLWHFAHDTPPLSQGGIAWLWPLDSRYWSLKGPSEPHAPALSHREWLEKFWLRPSPLLFIEMGAGIAALALALLIASL